MWINLQDIIDGVFDDHPDVSELRVLAEGIRAGDKQVDLMKEVMPIHRWEELDNIHHENRRRMINEIKSLLGECEGADVRVEG